MNAGKTAVLLLILRGCGKLLQVDWFSLTALGIFIFDQTWLKSEIFTSVEGHDLAVLLLSNIVVA